MTWNPARRRDRKTRTRRRAQMPVFVTQPVRQRREHTRIVPVDDFPGDLELARRLSRSELLDQCGR